MNKLCVIGWRPHAKPPLFFRGDRRYEIYLPFISDELLAEGPVKGWVTHIKYARVFEHLVPYTMARDFISDRLERYPYTDAILPTQIFWPIKRPPNRSHFHHL